jgi:copper(I)-binding protein
MSRPAILVWVGLALIALASVLFGGCTYYPGVVDIGGVRLRPEQGRAVRSAGGQEAAVYFQVNSTGKYGDVLIFAESPEVARKAELRDPSGSRIGEIEIPGATVMAFHRSGPNVVLSDFRRTLEPGEVIIVTLHFQKSGPLGLITVVE